MKYNVFAEVGYYEVNIRPFQEGDVPTYYDGASGLFVNHKNAFRTFESAMNYFEKRNFVDFNIHKSFEAQLLKRLEDAYVNLENVELEYCADNEYIIRLW